MNKDDWKIIEAAFQESVELTAEAREAFLAAFDGERPDLAAQLRKLVAADLRRGDTLAKPIEAAVHAVVGQAGDPWIGRTIGVWKITRRIAGGGMGAVFLGERADEQYEHSVAIKVMNAQLLASDAVARFRAERQILANLNHPYIAQLYDGGATDEKLPYLVMEYIDGQPIDEYCDEHGLGVDERLALFRKVCDAVDYAHRNLIVHRDLKPSNILVDARGNPKLLDFGIAKLLSAETANVTVAVTKEGTRAMTPEYASPEQVRGEPVAVATDVYSLGVLLYRLMTGQSPYSLSSATPLEYQRAILEQDPKRPSTLVSETGADRKDRGSATATHSSRLGVSAKQLQSRLSGDLDNIALKTLQKAPERRYHSVSALSQDVGRYLRNEPVEARGNDWAYVAKKFAVRNARELALFGLVLVGVATLVTFYTLRVAAERDRAQLEASKAAEVTNYLTELFAAADPSVSLGETITAQTLLERGASRIDDELAEQPELQAALLKAIGASYSNMGEYESSLAQVEKVLALETGIEDLDPTEASRTHHLLGYLLQELGEYDRSLAEFEEALRLLASIGQPRSIEAGNSLRFIGKNYDDKGEFEKAAEAYEEAIEILRSHGPAAYDELTSALQQYGVHLRSVGEIAAEETLLLEALEINEDRYGEVHPKVASTLNSLGTHYNVRGNPEQARVYLERSITIKRQLYGDDNISVARTVANLGLVEAQLAEHSRALELNREALVVFKDKLGDEHPQVAFLTENIANELLALGQYDEAIATYRDSEVRLRTIFGEQHPEYAMTVSNVGGAFLVMGEFDEARRYLERADGILRSVYGDEHPAVGMNEVKLGVLAANTDQIDEAVRLYEDALGIFESNFGTADIETAQGYEKLGDALVQGNELAAAEEAFRRSVAQWAELDIANRPSWRVTARLGNALMRQGRYAEAEALLTPAYAWWTENVPADDEETAMIAGWVEELESATR